MICARYLICLLFVFFSCTFVMCFLVRIILVLKIIADCKLKLWVFSANEIFRAFNSEVLSWGWFGVGNGDFPYDSFFTIQELLITAFIPSSHQIDLSTVSCSEPGVLILRWPDVPSMYTNDTSLIHYYVLFAFIYICAASCYLRACMFVMCKLKAT